MNYLLYCLLWNMVFVTAASLVIYTLGVTRCLSERPALRYALWLLVLFKFVTPPLLAVPLLPAVQYGQPSSHDLLQVAEIDRGAKVPLTSDKFQSTEFSVYQSTRSNDWGLPGSILSKVLVCLSLTVTLIMGGLAIFQWYHLKKLSSHFIQPEQRLTEMLQSVCKSCQLSTAPELVVINMFCSPMLWVGFRRKTLILPRPFVETLSDEQLQQILAHEIAHLVRKDYLSSLLAFVVVSLFWWNPIAWLARREMFLAAEICCDAFAIAKTTGTRQSYARTLLAAVDYATHNKSVLPVWGTQFVESRTLERRIKMVASSPIKTALTHSHCGVIICLSLLVLILVPVRAEENQIAQEKITTEQKQDESIQSDRKQQEKKVVPPNTGSANMPTIPNVKLISWSGTDTSSRAYFFKTAQAAESFANLVKAFQLADQFKVEISDTKPMLADQDKRICIMRANHARQLGLEGNNYVLLQGTRAAHARLEEVVTALETKK